MAIKISGTTVIDDSRNITDVENVGDANTVYFGDGSNLTGAGGGSITATASGTLANGDTVVLNSDGTVSTISSSSSSTPKVYEGKQVFYNAVNNTIGNSNYYIPDENIIFTTFLYADSLGPSLSYRSVYSIGKVVGETIEYGQWNQFPWDPSAPSVQAAYYSAIAYDSNQSSVILAFSNPNDYTSSYVIAGPLNDSKTQVEWGDPVNFLPAGSYSTIYVRSLIYDTNAQKTLLTFVYRDTGTTNYHGRGRVVTVSGGNTVTLGTANDFRSASGDDVRISHAVYDTNAQKTLLIYGDDVGGGNVYARTATISGTTISYGTQLTVNSGSQYFATGLNISSNTVLAYDATAQKSVFAYYRGSNPNYTNGLRVFTISGTDVTVGSELAYETGSNIAEGKLCYNPSIGKCVLFTYQNTDKERESSIVTITGTTPTISTRIVYDVFYTGSQVEPVYESVSNYIVQSLVDEQAFVVRLFDIQPETTNLTSDNFIGFSDGAYTNGQTATIQTVGSTDDAQTGLTPGKKYYVKKNGDLSLNGNTTPLIFAGTALSSTEIIVKG